MKPEIARFVPLCVVLAVCAAGCLDPDDPGNLVRRTVTEDPSLPRLQVNGTVLHAEAFGNPANPVVLVIHGGPGGDYRSLLPLAALQDAGYYVVFWDQRGTGLSQRHDASAYTWSTLLEDFRQVVEHFAPDAAHPVVFIGHSWGAMYATWFINEHGDHGGRVRGAVLSDPGAFTKAQLDAYERRLTGGFPSFLDARVEDWAWIGQFMSQTSHERADYMLALRGFGEWPAAHCDENDPEPSFRPGAVAAATMMDLASRGFDWTTHLRSFTPLVLFLRGGLNEASRLQDQEEMAAAYGNARVESMPVGHCMIWERPAEYLAHVERYLQEIGFRGGQP